MFTVLFCMKTTIFCKKWFCIVFRAPEWNAITQHEWDKIGLKFENEGEFWWVENYSIGPRHPDKIG